LFCGQEKGEIKMKTIISKLLVVFSLVALFAITSDQAEAGWTIRIGNGGHIDRDYDRYNRGCTYTLSDRYGRRVDVYRSSSCTSARRECEWDRRSGEYCEKSYDDYRSPRRPGRYDPNPRRPGRYEPPRRHPRGGDRPSCFYWDYKKSRPCAPGWGNGDCKGDCEGRI